MHFNLVDSVVGTLCWEFKSAGWLLVIVFALNGCGHERDSDTFLDLDDFDDEPLPEFVSGHMEMESVNYTLSQENYTSGRTRIWYSFHRADKDWENKPLFVLFNGGPGSSTAILLAWNTGATTLDEHFTGGEATGTNPYSWTEMGNLLYIDARQTGFSYGLVAHPESEAIREEEFGIKNHNFIFDAAEFVRVIMRFARKYGSVRQNEIYLVGESYGGTRASAIMNLILKYREWGDGSRYYADPALTEEVQEHLDEVFPDRAGAEFSEEVIATQFSRQIMIQPFTVGERQRLAGYAALEEPGSPLYDIAADTGTPFTPCSKQGPGCDSVQNVRDFIIASGRDVYYMSKPQGWLLNYFFGGSQVLAFRDVLESVTGVSLETMDLMYAAQREEAFRGKDYEPPDETAFSYMPEDDRYYASQMAGIAARVNGDLAETYGELESHDTFYVSYASDVGIGFYTSTPNPYERNTIGDLMIENLGYVETFITNAALDFRVFTPGIPDALSEFTDEISSVSVDDGFFTVHFQPGLFGTGGRTEARVAFPSYPASGHTVSYSAPEALRNDVWAWIGK